MKYLLIPLALLAPIAICGNDTIGSLPNASPGAPGDKGAGDDTCWDAGDANVKLNVRGTAHGDQKVKVSSGEQCSPEVLGTPASDNGCRESQEMKLNGKTYRVKGGRVQVQKPDGTFKNCSETKDDKCAKDDELELY